MGTLLSFPVKLSHEHVKNLIVAACSCAIGSVAGIVGGIVGAIIAVAAVCALSVFFSAFAEKRKKEEPAPVEEAEVIPVVDDAPIPPDRIDPLTGLANENGLMAWFSEKAARIAMDGKGIIVLSSDLADFDQIERKYDKSIVDAVLIEVARRVATCAGDDGIAARTSGDEFAAVATVVPVKSEEVAEEQAGKLAELLQRPVELPSGVVWIGGSVGAAWGDVHDGVRVLGHAREALKKASRQGRGHYVVYNPEKN
jgi:diguanylate cyclase (GGDEF)-like protein